MIILGVDPGFSFTGFAIIKLENHKTYLVESGYLRLPATKSLPERVKIFHEFITQKVLAHQVTDISLETPFLGKNTQSFLKLGYLRGIIYLISAHHHIALHEYSPREVKQAVTGFGGASKDQVARIVLQLFPKMVAPDKQDVTDAIAVTLCGLWRNQMPQGLR